MGSIPLAVSPSVRTPGLALVVNLLAGVVSPGTAALRACILSPKGTVSGTITPGSQLIEGVGGEGNAATYLGAGTPGHLAAKALYAEYPLAQVDLAAPAEAAGNAATATIAFDSTAPITSARTVDLEIAGRIVEIVWQVGETGGQAGDKLVSEIGKLSSDLPVTAANVILGAVGTVTLTFKTKGTIGNDCQLYATVKDGAGGTVTLGAAAMAGGTTEPVFTTVLSLIAGKEYDLILLVAGNADAVAASATSGPGRLKTHITTYGTGFSARLQQAVVGVTGTLSAAKAGSAQHDFDKMQYVHCQAGRSLPCEWAGAEVGARLREEQNDPNVNRMRSPYLATLYGARDLVNDALTDAEVEDALQSGLSPIGYDSTNAVLMIRPITTYFKDGSSNPDDRVLDVGRPTGLFRVAKDLRVSLPQQFPKAKLIADLVAGDDDPPDGVIEERDVKAFVLSRLHFWVKKGVVRQDRLDAATADGSLIVRVNPSDAGQCDLVIPLSIVPALAKFSLVVNQA